MSKIPSRNQLRFMWRIHGLVWKLSGGRIGSNIQGMDVLQLVTTGHQSGEARSVLIYYIEGETGAVVVGSNAGAPHEPAWVRNLRAAPLARLVRGGESIQVEARFLDGEERAAIFRKFKDRNKDFSVYESMTDREIPLIALERR